MAQFPTNIEYAERGQGQALLFVPGSFGTGAGWNLLALWAVRRQVCRSQPGPNRQRCRWLGFCGARQTGGETIVTLNRFDDGVRRQLEPALRDFYEAPGAHRQIPFGSDLRVQIATSNHRNRHSLIVAV